MIGVNNLKGVHPDLVKVVMRASEICPLQFAILEGLRTEERQRDLVEAGASKTMNSRHLTGHAVDLGALVKGSVNWAWPLYEIISKAMKKAAKELDVPIVWGGDWKSFKDGPHYELEWATYP